MSTLAMDNAEIEQHQASAAYSRALALEAQARTIQVLSEIKVVREDEATTLIKVIEAVTSNDLTKLINNKENA